jgi:hypothetical protein
MDIQTILRKLRLEIHQVFRLIKNWMYEEKAVRDFRKSNESWSIDQILEHISLTNHYLLLLIRKGTKKALNKSKESDLKKELTRYNFYDPDLEEIGKAESFSWKSPEHMMPSGESWEIIEERFRYQYGQLTDILDQLKNGEGILHKTTMSVYGLGKLDVYQYIYFLTLHARRHIEQMEKIKKTFYSKPSPESPANLIIKKSSFK